MSTAGLIIMKDKEQAADTLLSLLTADFYLRKLLELPEKGTFEQAVSHTVEQFLQVNCPCCA